jgi:glycosyltransferase involved in cell wall biosynthesis
MTAKFAIISHVLPPSPSGQAVALFRILAAVPADAYYLVLSKGSPGPDAHGADDRMRLPGRHYSLPPSPARKWPDGTGLRLIGDIVRTALRVRTIRKDVLAILRREPGTQAVIACSGDLATIPGSFLASRKARIPFFAYIFDDYVYQWTGLSRLLAKRLAPFVFRHCAGIIAPNEFICAAYRRRYGVKTILVRNPYPAHELAAGCLSRWPTESGRIKIFFAGAIYRANDDCFRNLIQALSALPEYRFTLDIFTGQSRQRLEAMGIRGERVFVHAHAPYEHIQEAQRQADILFLPLSFAAPLHEVLRTAAPGKMGECLASGRPVLAHVPADSFVADYFRRHRCGWIADQGDPGAIARELASIIEAPELRAEMTANARRQALLDFSPETAREKLLASLPLR